MDAIKHIRSQGYILTPFNCPFTMTNVLVHARCILKKPRDAMIELAAAGKFKALRVAVAVAGSPTWRYPPLGFVLQPVRRLRIVNLHCDPFWRVFPFLCLVALLGSEKSKAVNTLSRMKISHV